MQQIQFSQLCAKNQSNKGFSSALYLANEFIPINNTEVWISINKECLNSIRNVLSIARLMNDLKVEVANKDLHEEVNVMNYKSISKNIINNTKENNPSRKISMNKCKQFAYEQETVISSYNTIDSGLVNHRYPNSILTDCFDTINKNSLNNAAHDNSSCEKKSNCYVSDTWKKDNIVEQTIKNTYKNQSKSSTDYRRVVNQPVTMNTMVYLHLLSKKSDPSNDQSVNINQINHKVAAIRK